ncbi:MAG: DUF4234 domain-containing protein [Bacilli bacterium]|nr:DUF4234 domain-containing protein [Bacilli bacterium]
MIRERNLVTCIILTIITCGIYGIIWFISLTDDVKTASNDTQLAGGGMAFLFTLLTCGIYGYYWAYKMGKLVNQARVNRGLSEDDKSILFIILQFFGLGIVNYALIQSELNDFAKTNA